MPVVMTTKMKPAKTDTKYAILGHRAVALTVVSLEGDTYYRRTTSRNTFKRLATLRYDALFDTRKAANAYINPGKRKIRWIVDTYNDTIQKIEVALDGRAYNPDTGSRLHSRENRKQYTSEKAARKGLREHLEEEAKRYANELASLRRKIRQLKV